MKQIAEEHSIPDSYADLLFIKEDGMHNVYACDSQGGAEIAGSPPQL